MTAMLECPANQRFGPIARILSDGLIIANFGASDDRGHELPDIIRRSITLIELDAISGSRIPENYYRRIIRVRKGIAGSKGVRQFRISRNPGASSLLHCDLNLVRQYGIENFLEAAETRQIDCVTVQDLLREHALPGLDFLKTDLEGVDFEVIQSCAPLFDRICVIQAELRFQPFFKGEPHFHDVAAYLNHQGFDLIGLKPEYWKSRTSHRDHQRKGRAVWADVLFFKRPSYLLTGPVNPVALVKQIILAIMLGHENYAETLLELYAQYLPEECSHDLAGLIASRASTQLEVPHPNCAHVASE